MSALPSLLGGASVNLSERDKEERTVPLFLKDLNKLYLVEGVTLKRADETSAHAVKMTY